MAAATAGVTATAAGMTTTAAGMTTTTAATAVLRVAQRRRPRHCDPQQQRSERPNKRS
jgi:hypothetical protein